MRKRTAGGIVNHQKARIFFGCVVLVIFILSPVLGNISNLLKNHLDQITTASVRDYGDTFNPNNATTQGAQWDGIDGSNTQCFFKPNGYHVVQSTGIFNLHACHEDSYAYVNAVIEVNVTILKGDSGGLFFRFNKDSFGNYTGYLFEIDHEGNYKFSIFTSIFTMKNLLNILSLLISNPETVLGNVKILWSLWSLLSSNPLTVLRDWTFSSALKPGYGVTNTLAVIINGNTFELYANDTPITTLTDPSNKHNYGDVGFFASAPDADTDVAFSNLKIWQQS